MFKRRSTRKKNKNRKTWYRPRINRKEKLAKKVDFDEAQSTITREDIIVGNGNESYKWELVTPIGDMTVKDETKSIGCGKVQTLKNLCAAKITANIESLDKSYLNYGSWSVWSLVWEWILIRSIDSFKVYTLFAAKFSANKDFKAHLIRRYLDQTHNEYDFCLMTRNKAIDLFKIPNCNHRIENLFCNIDLLKFGITLSNLSFNPLVILDFSLVGNDQNLVAVDNPSKLCNIPNLLILNLSNNSIIDDNYIFNLCLRLKNSTTSKLTMIILNKCPKVTKVGIQYLINLADSNPCCCLSYIESDHNMVTSDFNRQFESQLNGGTYINYIEDTKWYKLDRDRYEIELIYKLPLALKLNSLCRLFKDNFNQKGYLHKFAFLQNFKDETIIDFMLHPDLYNEVSLVQGLVSIWSSRINQRSSLKHSGYCYMINNNFTKSWSKSIRIKNPIESKPILEQKVSISNRTKTKTITTSALSYFANAR